MNKTLVSGREPSPRSGSAAGSGKAPGEQEKEELSLLLDIARTINKYVELRAALGPVLGLLETRAALTGGMVTLLDRASGLLKIVEALDLSPGEKAKGSYRLGEGPVGRVFETGEALTQEQKGFYYYCVPISSGIAVIGTLSARRRNGGERRPNHLQVVGFLEKVSSIISDSVKLRERIAEERPAREQHEISENAEPAATLEAALSRLEKELIVAALKTSKGNMAAGARRLGISERQMGLRLERYGIDWKVYRAR